MDLTGALVRAGAARPHVLVAAMPGSTAVRLVAERELRLRGWPAALTPADTDLLLVAGEPAADMTQAVEGIWRTMPAPRVRVVVARPQQMAATLDQARAELASAAAQHPGTDGAAAMHDGLPMADRGPDRDGLSLDRLHVPLGPVLPGWPAGLVLHLTLQGDVIQQARAETVGAASGPGSFWSGPWRDAVSGDKSRMFAAARLDSLARLLDVAGWPDTAIRARALRDQALDGQPAGALRPAVRRLTRRVARSRVLAWSTRGLGSLPAAGDVTAGNPVLAGDVTARYRRWCAEAADAIARTEDPLPPPRGGPGESAALLEVLPRLLEGAEFAAARLIVASLDPDLDELVKPAGAGHGH